MRTRTRFILLFSALGLVVMAIGLGAIYRAVALDSSRRIPIEAEHLLAEAAALSLDGSVDPDLRLQRASEALFGARALLARNRILVSDPVIGLAVQVAAILAAVLLAAALVFGLLARVFTRGIEELVAGVLRAGSERSWRFPASKDPELGRVREAINALLDLNAEQEARLAAGARLEGWREVASFLAHQIKNPLAALSLAAENGRLALEAPARTTRGTVTGEPARGTVTGEPTRGTVTGEPARGTVTGEPARGTVTGVAGTVTGEALAVARESLAIVGAETGRLAALISRFRDLAPAGLEAYAGGGSLDLLELLEGCAARARKAGAEVGIEILRGGEKMQVQGDRALLEQAFWNLFANSLEAAGGAPVSIRVRLKAEGGEVAAILDDSNGSIDPAIVVRLGAERVTTKRGGTGLGLLLVRRILELQGGRIEFSLGDAGGLVATVRLPLVGGAG